MAEHIERGREGERLAEQHLAGLGYAILHHNWRYGHLEIDLIATKDSVLHFVEVKLRSSSGYGPPEAAVNRAKFKKLCRAAEAFLVQHPQFHHVRFDILSVQRGRSGNRILFIEDVFF